ncbi:MAG: M23 family metallopeptidase [Clostridia bacterium]|nr:M23 family metallopeptidase [Clostridia bacterium]
MKPTYTNQPVNTVSSRKNAGTPPVGILVFMTLAIASVFFIKEYLPIGNTSEEADGTEEAAYVYGEFAEDTAEDTEDINEDIDTAGEEAVSAAETSPTDGGDIAKHTAFILPLINNITDNPIAGTKTVSVFPLDGEITSYFGTRKDPFGSDSVETHLGIDIAGGTDIYACSDGQVEKVGESESYGNYIVIRHNEKVESLYAHCEKIFVSGGDSVAAGDVIAKAGKTGNATGVHLHFEIRVNGNRVDPLDYVIYRDQ